MLNRNRLEFHFTDHSRTMWMQKALIELWWSASGCRLPEDARKEIISFVQSLPMHSRRKESEDDFITRHVLIEIEKRSRNKWKAALNTFPPAYLSDYHIRNEMWDEFKRISGLGGFSNQKNGIYLVYFDDRKDDFIYHFHDRPIDPAYLHEDSHMIPVIYKEEVVFVEYNSKFFSTQENIEFLIKCTMNAMRKKMGE